MLTKPIDPTVHTVYVWQVALAQTNAVVEDAARVLAPDEMARAARFVFDRDRRRFLLTRAALRHVLGERLGLTPEAVRFSYSPAGKPFLAPPLGEEPPADLAFNVSHSHELALLGLSYGRSLGVDLEYRRNLPDLLEIAQRFFSPREAVRLRAVPPAEQAAAFFRCWTRKEAYLKARGDGLMAGLDRFDVSFLAGEPPALVNTMDDPGETARWTLFDLIPAPDYAAAVAVTGPPPRLQFESWHFPGTYASALA